MNDSQHAVGERVELGWPLRFVDYVTICGLDSQLIAVSIPELEQEERAAANAAAAAETDALAKVGDPDPLTDPAAAEQLSETSPGLSAGAAAVPGLGSGAAGAGAGAATARPVRPPRSSPSSSSSSSSAAAAATGTTTTPTTATTTTTAAEAASDSAGSSNGASAAGSGNSSQESSAAPSRSNSNATSIHPSSMSAASSQVSVNNGGAASELSTSSSSSSLSSVLAAGADGIAPLRVGYQPALLCRFPAEDHADSPFPLSIEQFCFPSRAFLHEIEAPTSSSHQADPSGARRGSNLSTSSNASRDSGIGSTASASISASTAALDSHASSDADATMPGISLVHVVPPPKFHTFVLTEISGTRLHGCCLTFYEQVDDKTLAVLRERMAVWEKAQAAKRARTLAAMSAKIKLEEGIAARLDEKQRDLVAMQRSQPGSVVVQAEIAQIAQLLEDSREKVLLYRDFRQKAVGMTTQPLVASRVLAPKSICTISHWPLYSVFGDYLKKIFCMLKRPEGLDVPLERYFVHMCYEVPLPPPGKMEVKLSLGDTDIFVSRPAVNDYYPLIADLPIELLFKSLDLPNIVKLFGCMLLERKIVFYSDNLSLLHACVDTLSQLLYPFHWQHVYIPVLPFAMVSVLEAPMPFVIGLPGALRPLPLPADDIIKVDLDANTVSTSTGSGETMGFDDQVAPADLIPVLPPVLEKLLLHKLKQAHANLFGRLDAELLNADATPRTADLAFPDGLDSYRPANDLPKNSIIPKGDKLRRKPELARVRTQPGLNVEGILSSSASTSPASTSASSSTSSTPVNSTTPLSAPSSFAALGQPASSAPLATSSANANVDSTPQASVRENKWRHTLAPTSGSLSPSFDVTKQPPSRQPPPPPSAPARQSAVPTSPSSATLADNSASLTSSSISSGDGTPADSDARPPKPAKPRMSPAVRRPPAVAPTDASPAPAAPEPPASSPPASSPLVQPQSTTPPMSEWLHGKISAVDAENMLISTGVKGSFLVRESQTKAGAFTISLRRVDVVESGSLNAQSVSHFRIEPVGAQFSCGGRVFDSITDIVARYMKDPISPGVCLSTPMPPAPAELPPPVSPRNLSGNPSFSRANRHTMVSMPLTVRERLRGIGDAPAATQTPPAAPASAAVPASAAPMPPPPARQASLRGVRPQTMFVGSGPASTTTPAAAAAAAAAAQASPTSAASDSAVSPSSASSTSSTSSSLFYFSTDQSAPTAAFSEKHEYNPASNDATYMRDHIFEPKKFNSKVKTCVYCSGNVTGINARQALECERCSIACHKKCMAFVTSSCRIAFVPAGVRKAFLRIMLTILKNYRQFLNTPELDDDNSTGEEWFNKEAFLASHDKELRPFVAQVLDTQSFSQFTLDRMERPPSDFEVLFFDESLKERQNRKFTKLTKEATPFLSDNRFRVSETIAARSPSLPAGCASSSTVYSRVPVELNPALLSYTVATPIINDRALDNLKAHATSVTRRVKMMKLQKMKRMYEVLGRFQNTEAQLEAVQQSLLFGTCIDEVERTLATVAMSEAAMATAPVGVLQESLRQLHNAQARLADAADVSDADRWYKEAWDLTMHQLVSLIVTFESALAKHNA
ncbi:hypothetical protein CAOG_00406 [Capsaspora owczarzaki ATCC 30864]|uniref:Uncharacterized protein n=1 Tax=Capsaspora owczarzaki (strain ATCC 30864) TaxID=595528 RepID=A0A0D2U0Q6_CAPO3|nr:hypothetical protein CAOG_00406 [Capsaspora owczarzaki ATCC 30864]KJE88826.1 hypothetical protein CAOG_000406 [Capsaspora owczarzaki ATCC 30864]|eukprot:XP_004365277.1 hypothetical protein CAOG_00406 [Capsaspora owczarzaki ATCC 30864]